MAALIRSSITRLAFSEATLVATHIPYTVRVMKISTIMIEARRVRPPATDGSIGEIVGPASVGSTWNEGVWKVGPLPVWGRLWAYSTTAAPNVATCSRWIVALLGPSLPWKVKSSAPPVPTVTCRTLSRRFASISASPAWRLVSAFST